MLTMFRSFFQSKLGVVITLGFLGVIALAFASMDLASTNSLGGVAGGDRVAVVGDRRIDSSELAANANNAFLQMRAENPTLTMEAFVAGGGVQRTLEQMISRTALAEFAREQGLRAGKRLVDSEIRQIPAFRDITGQFNAEAYNATLRQQGLSDAMVREDLAMGLYARQLVTPVSLGTNMPASIARRYAQLLGESRTGAIALLPSAAFAPEGDPSDSDLQTYYQANRSNYIRPERRVIRYAAFGPEALGELPAPTEAQIAERYEQDSDGEYAAQETRGFTQLIVPTQAAAQAIIDEVAGGTPFEASAREKGLATTRIGPIDRQDLAGSSSAAVAEAGFSAAQGALTTPARGNLGWYVLRVDDITSRAQRSLADARSDIAATLAAEQREEALTALTDRIDEELSGGRNLGEVASEFGFELQQTPALTADGRVYGEAQPAPAIIAPVLATAFEMREDEPQLAVVAAGEQYLIYEAAEITESATAPLDEIRDNVTEAWRRNQGSIAAREAAQRVMDRVAKGTDLAAALAAEEASLPPVDEIAISRNEIGAQDQVPAALALMFSMAEGTVKRLAAPQEAGWFVVALEDIEAPELEAGDPQVGPVALQLKSALAEEHLVQFITAVQREVKSQRNDSAVQAVIAQLSGRAN